MKHEWDDDEQVILENIEMTNSLQIVSNSKQDINSNNKVVMNQQRQIMDERDFIEDYYTKKDKVLGELM